MGGGGLGRLEEKGEKKLISFERRRKGAGLTSMGNAKVSS